MNSFMGAAYQVFKVTEGWLDREISVRQTPEPYYSQVRPSIGALVGQTEALRELRDYKAILDLIRSNNAWPEMVRGASESGDLSEVRRNAPALCAKLQRHAAQYKVVRNTDIARSLEESIRRLAVRLASDVSQNRKVSLMGTTPAEFYPEDERFVRIARLTVESEIARQDAHHLNYRGHWPVRERLKPLAEWLAGRGEISCLAGLFDYPPDWLLRQAIRFRSARWLEDFLGRPCAVPPVPEELSMGRFGQLRSMGFDFFYLPALGAVTAESCGRFPGWRYPLSDRYWIAGMNGTPLIEGRWVAVELAEGGQLQVGGDEGEKALHYTGDREKLASWDSLCGAILPKMSQLLGVDHSRVRLPFAIEWNLLGNLLRHRRRRTPDAPVAESAGDAPSPVSPETHGSEVPPKLDLAPLRV